MIDPDDSNTRGLFGLDWSVTGPYDPARPFDPAWVEAIGHLRLVVSIAVRYTGQGLTLADLVQEGLAAVKGAVEGYDPRRSAFTTYATTRIRRRLRRAIETQGGAGAVAAGRTLERIASRRDRVDPLTWREVEAAIDRLEDGRERFLVRARYGLACRPLKLREAAVLLGMSIEGARLLTARGVEHVRELLGEPP